MSLWVELAGLSPIIHERGGRSGVPRRTQWEMPAAITLAGRERALAEQRWRLGRPCPVTPAHRVAAAATRH